MQRLSCILPFFLSLNITPINTPEDSDFKRYLKTVYPTSQTIENMSNADAERYYNQLHFWYRVPTPQRPNGLLSRTPKIFSGTFLQSDLVAIDGEAGETIGVEGFPNARYIEVASYGFLPFRDGAYYYWSPGSGIFLNTDGSTLIAYNKIHMIYKLSGESKSNFIKKLQNIPMVQLQAWGKAQLLDHTMLKEICNMNNTYYYVNEYLDMSHGPSLLGSLASSPEWPSVYHKLCHSSAEEAREFLLTIYLNDHIEGKYHLTNHRYAYIIGEANDKIDRWLYDVARQKNISVLQLTRLPNNYFKTAFEILDARWPVMDPEITTIKELTTQWNDTVSKRWIQLRDPFNINDDRFSKNITLSFPSLTRFEETDDWFNGKDGTRFLKFATDNSANGGFSMTDVEHNTRLLYQTRQSLTLK